MSDCLNVIALISGGKDSIFSLLHCMQNGHKIVALANLYPATAANHGGSSEDTGVPTDSVNAETIEVESSDLNSFMYQTVGHSLIPLYSTALQIPLYRRQICGSSIQQSQYYDTSSRSHSDAQPTSDETEDLIPLLLQVISVHPEANALSTGAILSTYQRTRVESVAVRLGLTPLSYLWQYPVLPPPRGSTDSAPQYGKHRLDSLTGLLEDIALSGLDARIIKIASAGIPESILFSSVAAASTQTRLVNGLSPFFEDDDELGLRGAVLGEGGEYETIALSGPRELWKGGKIEIEPGADQSYVSEGVNYFRFGTAKVTPYEVVDEANTGATVERQLSNSLVPRLALLDHQFWCIDEDLGGFEPDAQTGNQAGPKHHTTKEQHKEPLRLSDQLSCVVTSNAIAIDNLTATSISDYTASQLTTSENKLDSTGSAAEQMRRILAQLPNLLGQLSRHYNLAPLSAVNISSTTILLRSISDFASVNPIYSQIYPVGLPNPPARVTIAVPLPEGTKIRLSLILDKCSADLRRGLHVQGRSYWAPANIGPYSQAVAVPLWTRSVLQDYLADDRPSQTDLEIVHIAGQIPLVPASMAVHSGTFLSTTVLSLQHLWRVGQERGVDFWPWGVAYLSQNGDADIETTAGIAGAVWQRAHLNSTWAQSHQSDEEDDDIDNHSSNDESPRDVWDMQRNRSLYQGFRRSNITVGKHLHLLPNHALFHASKAGKTKYVPPYLAVEASALPRNVSVEWWSNGIAGFTKSRSRQRVGLSWQCNTFDWGNLSTLHITPDPMVSARKVVFISFMVDAKEGIVPSTLPRSLPEIMHLIVVGTESKSVDTPVIAQDVKIVQGTAFVTTSTLNSALWARFADTFASSETDEQSSIRPKHTATDILSSTSIAQGLSSQTNIVPCHRLWGSAVTSTTVSQSKDVSGLASIPGLALAFILRVNVDEQATLVD